MYRILSRYAGIWFDSQYLSSNNYVTMEWMILPGSWNLVTVVTGQSQLWVGIDSKGSNCSD